MDNDLSRRVQSIEVGFSILRAFAEKKGPLTLNELAGATNLFKSQLYRYLNSFVQLGVIVREDGDNPRYRLGPELISLGSAASDSLDITHQSAVFLTELRDKLNETVAVSIWRERGPFFIRREESRKPINVGLDIGSYVPLYTATGKIFRAFMPEEITDTLYRQEIEAGNIRPELYDPEIESVRRKRLAVTESSLISGIASISTPIFSSGKFAGALSIVGVLGELDISENSEAVRQLFKTAEDISHRLGT